MTGDGHHDADLGLKGLPFGTPGAGGPGAVTALLMDELRDAREELRRSRDRGPWSGEHLVRQVVIPTLDLLDDAAMADPGNFDEVARTCAGLAQSTGVERIDPLGELVDPREHQVVGPPPGAGRRAGAVLRPGYRYDGRLLRPATVRAEAAGDEGQVVPWGSPTPPHEPARVVAEPPAGGH